MRDIFAATFWFLTGAIPVAGILWPVVVRQRREFEVERDELQERLEAIRTYGKEGPTSSGDGYPLEIAYDEFAYRRMVDSYRDAATEAKDG